MKFSTLIDSKRMESIAKNLEKIKSNKFFKADMGKITFIILIITALAAIAGAFGNFSGIQQDEKSTEAIISAGQEGDKILLDAINKVDQKQAGLLELALVNFKPELLYKINFVSRDNEPNSIYVEIENTGTHHTTVNNTWTITGDYCSGDGQHYVGNDDYIITSSANLTKQNPINETRIVLPDFLFDDLEKIRSFLLMLELEMMPFTPSSGPVNLPVPRKTFIQFDHNEGEYPDWWMLTLARGGDIHCDTEPSIWRHVVLNTTKIEDFNLWPR